MKRYYLLSKLSMPVYLMLKDGEEVGIPPRGKVGPFDYDPSECKYVKKMIDKKHLILLVEEVQPSVSSAPSSGSVE